MSGVLWEELYDAVCRAKAGMSADIVEAAADPDEEPCTECTRLIGSGGRWYANGKGSLVPYCKACAEIGYPVRSGDDRR